MVIGGVKVMPAVLTAILLWTLVSLSATSVGYRSAAPQALASQLALWPQHECESDRALRMQWGKERRVAAGRSTILSAQQRALACCHPDFQDQVLT